MVDTMRVTLAREQRRHRVLGLLILIGGVADAALMYIVLHAPTR